MQHQRQPTDEHGPYLGDGEQREEADEIGRRTILDLVEDETAEGIDVAPGSRSYRDAILDSLIFKIIFKKIFY